MFVTAPFTMKTYIRYIIVIVAAVLGGFLGKRYSRYVKSLGTAVIGAFILIKGISMYAGGFPADIQGVIKHKFNPVFIAYVVGYIAFNFI